MKKSHLVWLLFLAILSACMFQGCTSSSKKHIIVQEKTELNTDSYHQDSDTLKDTENFDSRSVHFPEGSDFHSENPLADRLQVPETTTYTNQFEGDSLKLSCQAKIEVPDADQFSVYKVSQKPFDQAWIDQVTDVFFGDRPVYDYEKYNQHTGEKKEVSPCLEDKADPVSPFFGIVEMDGGIFLYKLKKSDPFHMDIGILRGNGDDSDNTWSGSVWSQPYQSHTVLSPEEYIPPREEAEKMAGITPAQAIKMTDRYMKKLGLSDFSVKHIEACFGNRQAAISPENTGYQDAVYLVIYTRDIHGFPVTPEDSDGGAHENMDDTLHTWGYEKIEFYVNQEGLQKASIQNLYQIEEQLIHNVELMSFPEIMEIFGQIMPLHFKNNTDKINIDRITLGYMKIYDPGLDSTTGLLVPVWDFFGSREGYSSDGSGPYTVAYPTISLLTINAADGSVIDRDYGY